MRWLIMLGFALAFATGAQGAPMAEQGSGPYPALFEMRADLPDHVVYRPKALARLGAHKLGIYVFGNGGCSDDGTASRNHLLEIASHGYLVIAPGHIPDGKTRDRPAPSGKLTAQTPTGALSEAIDWAQRENGRRGSPFHGRVAVDQIAVSGWSCGGLQALSVAQEPRVKTAIIMNSGYFNDGVSPIAGITSDKAMLARLHSPILYILGGPADIAWPNGTDDFRRINHVPAALVNVPVGHGGTYMQPHGGIGGQMATAWLDWQLRGSKAAARQFTGKDCGFCRDGRLTIETKNMP